MIISHCQLLYFSTAGDTHDTCFNPLSISVISFNVILTRCGWQDVSTKSISNIRGSRLRETERTPLFWWRLSLNPPCGNHILRRVLHPLAVIRPRRASRCDRGAGGVEQREPHVNEQPPPPCCCHLRIRWGKLAVPSPSSES